MPQMFEPVNDLSTLLSSVISFRQYITRCDQDDPFADISVVHDVVQKLPVNLTPRKIMTTIHDQYLNLKLSVESEARTDVIRQRFRALDDTYREHWKLFLRPEETFATARASELFTHIGQLLASKFVVLDVEQSSAEQECRACRVCSESNPASMMKDGYCVYCFILKMRFKEEKKDWIMAERGMIDGTNCHLCGEPLVGKPVSDKFDGVFHVSCISEAEQRVAKICTQDPATVRLIIHTICERYGFELPESKKVYLTL